MSLRSCDKDLYLNLQTISWCYFSEFMILLKIKQGTETPEYLPDSMNRTNTNALLFLLVN